MSKKVLVLVRHAHRDKPFGRAADNGLSAKGKIQSKAIRDFYVQRFDSSTKALLLSSPKVRCLETLRPLATRLRVSVKTDPLLEEQDPKDPDGERTLLKNVGTFIHKWKRSPVALTVACSHGDWLPLAIEELVGIPVDMKKGAWVEIKLEGKEAELTWVVQKP